ncbi:MAG: DNA-processing protein DprA [Clostridia bacterium]|nr:DNA-processing protein DprA [Clostridia bacterium]
MTINYWYEYSKIIGIKPIDKYELIIRFKNPEILFNLTDHEILCSGIISQSQIKHIRSIEYTDHINDFLEKEKITVFNIYDCIYPELLKRIYDPPVVLFAKGNLSLLKRKLIAIVGSRKNNGYSKVMCEEISRELSLNEYVIVSGMAAGIDSIAHKSAVKGNTIAVLGFGFNMCYPKENQSLMKEIGLNSLLLSEYPMNRKVEKMNFPMRNRIISGLCFATIIIEASEKSGSLITADFTIENNRELFVLPQQIGCHSAGGNKLIKDGATIISSIDELIEEIKNVENN